MSSPSVAFSSTTTLENTPLMTSTGPLAMTTPFIQGPDCTDIFNTTTVVREFLERTYTTASTVTALVSGPTDGARFESCQPPGWTNVATESQFVFSPAVCPSGWTAYDMSLREQRVPSTGDQEEHWQTMSQAYCCAEGFDLDWPTLSLYLPIISNPACLRVADSSPVQQPPGATTTTVQTTSEQYPSLVTIHQAWTIQWEQSDTSTLSPKPPDLPSGVYVPTWVPGGPVSTTISGSQSTSTSYPDELPGLQSYYFFAVIGLPILVSAVLLWCCIGWMKRDREE